jgi:hypothetical protein
VSEVPHIIRFRCKCVICGTIEYKYANEIPEDGPVCSQCMGPMTVQRADVRVVKPGRW